MMIQESTPLVPLVAPFASWLHPGPPTLSPLSVTLFLRHTVIMRTSLTLTPNPLLLSPNSCLPLSLCLTPMETLIYSMTFLSKVSLCLKSSMPLPLRSTGLFWVPGKLTSPPSKSTVVRQPPFRNSKPRLPSPEGSFLPPPPTPIALAMSEELPSSRDPETPCLKSALALMPFGMREIVAG
jgi:hypothetical protein